MNWDLEYDLVIVGGGPAGLAAAIALKQRQPALQICLLEKAARLGAHQLSGALVPDNLLDELLPGGLAALSLATPVTEHEWRVLGRRSAWRLPGGLLPPALRLAPGLQILSLGDLCRTLGAEAEALGVEIFTGQAVVAGCYGADGRLEGVQTGDLGRDPQGQATTAFAPGIRIGAPCTLVAEGARGSFSGELIRRFGLKRQAGPQHYAMGFKELWRSDVPRWQPGAVWHTLGWPGSRGAGGFAYAASPQVLHLGWVMPLTRGATTQDPYAGFEQYKCHPWLQQLLIGAQRQGFGARLLDEGGWAAQGALRFPGGSLLGCCAGLLDLRQRQGIANAITSGLQAALSYLAVDGASYDTVLRAGPVGQALRQAAPVGPALSRRGGSGYLAVHYWLQALRPTWGLPLLRYGHHGGGNGAVEAPATLAQARDQALFDARLHSPAQPCHLQGRQGSLQAYREPRALQVLSRCCPGGVYQLVAGRLQLQPENCLHCKCCEVQDPGRWVRWTPPEGGSGPRYTGL